MKKYHLDEIQSPEIGFSEIELPSLSSIFSLSNGMNLWNAYNLGGTAYTWVLAAASYADQTLQLNGITNKNYLSLSSFWGVVGWSAAKQINSFGTVPTGYKLPLSSTTALASLGMVILGPDIFAPKIDFSKTLQSIKLIASFFDKTGGITKLGEKFQEGYFQGVTHSLKNIPQLCSNKFIKSVIQTLGVDAVKLFLLQKFFQYTPSGKFASFLAVKDANPFNYLFKLVLLKTLKKTVEFLHEKATTQLNNDVVKDINKEVAELVLQEGNTQKVMALGEKVNNLAYDIELIRSKATQDVSAILGNIVMPLIQPQPIKTNQSNNIIKTISSFLTLRDLDEIYSGNTSEWTQNFIDTTLQSKNNNNPKNIIHSNPLLLLLDSVINAIFSIDNITSIINLTKSGFFITQKETQEIDDYVEIEQTKMGALSLTKCIDPKNYSYENIQEIAKLGGNSFMLNKLLSYLEKTPQDLNAQANIQKFSEFVREVVQEFLYTGLFVTQNLSQEQFFSLEVELAALSRTLGFERVNIFQLSSAATPQEIMSTLKFLKEPHQGGAKRDLSKDMTLSIKNYHLKKGTDCRDMLFIEDLKFSSGEVYAIMGKIGTGKTTVLTDIAKCLSPVFSSDGTILYPTYGNAEVEGIFCGTISFSPPCTTLFEKLTYRIDQNYVSNNKQQLMTNAVELFESFNQKGFTEERLLTKSKDDKLPLSTGQSKMVMLISAILYKQYLNKPVLFVIDETLANIDKETSDLICSKIKNTFKDSIIISVDHNAEYNESFYSKFVDLAGFSVGVDDKVYIESDSDILLGKSEN